MRFFTDENLPRDAIDMLRRNGHDVKDVRESGYSSYDDRTLINLAREENRILISADKDFSNILYFPPEDYPGIIVLRLKKPTRERITSVLENFIASIKEESIKNRLTILEDARVRRRPE